MQTRNLGRSGLHVSALGMVCMNLSFGTGQAIATTFLIKQEYNSLRHKYMTMKSIITSFTFLLLSTIIIAQKIEKKTIEQRLAAIEDKMAIKYVVDEFSNLADTKEIDKQVLLFTRDGVVQSSANGQQPTVLKGREQLKQAFSGFLSNFHTVYHQNGQQTIDLQGDKAETVSYCRVILVGKQGDKLIKTTLYAIYKDAFIKENGKWLIKYRTSDFMHREVEEIK